MEREAVGLIQETAVKAADPLQRVLRVPNEPAHVYYLIDADGKASKKYTELPRERSASLSIASLAEWAKVHVEMGVEVWYSRTGVVALCREGGDRTTLALTTSAPLRVLSQIAERPDGTEHDQGTLWRMLRTVFRDCTPSHPNLRDQVGRVDVKKAQEAAGTIDRKGTSVSRKLMAEASGADQLPEVLTFDVPVFTEASAPVKALVRVAFDFDAQSERFRLCVLPGEIDRANFAGEQWLESTVNQSLVEVGADVAVYHGKPD